MDKNILLYVKLISYDNQLINKDEMPYEIETLFVDDRIAQKKRIIHPHL